MLAMMLDLETLGLTPGARILQVGVAFFTRREVIASHSWGLGRDLDSSGYVDPGTLAWWETQAPEVREKVFAGDSSIQSPEHVIHELQVLCDVMKPSEVWADSPSFDCAIYRAFAGRHGFITSAVFPFTHRQERDFRTLKNLFVEINGVEPAQWGNPLEHDAEADARNQAERAVKMLAAIRGGEEE